MKQIHRISSEVEKILNATIPAGVENIWDIESYLAFAAQVMKMQEIYGELYEEKFEVIFRIIQSMAGEEE